MAREETRSRERGSGSNSGSNNDRDRGRDRGRGGSTSKSGGRSVAINLDPTSYETYGLWGDATDVEILDAHIGIFNYGGKLKDDGKPQVTTALFVTYLDEETGEEHTEPLSAGDPRFYAPGNSPNEEDYAGGSAEDFRGLSSGDTTPNEDMKGEYMLPVAQSYDDEGNPIYKRMSAARGSNMDFYLHQLAECCKAAGIPLQYDKDDPSVRKLLVGFRGTLDRMSNTLRKGSSNANFAGGDKNKVLVFGEVFERKTESGSGASSKSKANGREETRDRSDRGARSRTEPAERTARSRRDEPTDDTDTPTPTDDADSKPAPRTRNTKKTPPAGPDAEFLSSFAEKVEAYVAEQKSKSIKRTKLTQLMGEYDDRTEANWALELVTENSDEVLSFWTGSKLFDYDFDTDVVSL